MFNPYWVEHFHPQKNKAKYLQKCVTLSSSISFNNYKPKQKMETIGKIFFHSKQDYKRFLKFRAKERECIKTLEFLQDSYPYPPMVAAFRLEVVKEMERSRDVATAIYGEAICDYKREFQTTEKFWPNY